MYKKFESILYISCTSIYYFNSVIPLQTPYVEEVHISVYKLVKKLIVHQLYIGTRIELNILSMVNKMFSFCFQFPYLNCPVYPLFGSV